MKERHLNVQHMKFHRKGIEWTGFYRLVTLPALPSIRNIQKKRKKSTDQFESLVEKPQKDGYTEDNIFQRTQTNPFSYIIILFTDTIIDNLLNFRYPNNGSFKSPLT